MSEGGRLHGRQRELDTLEELLAGAARGHGGVVLLEGEPGIGKSRLVAELAERASVSGFGVFVGRGDEIGSLRPFGPIVDALDLRPDSDDPDAALAGRILAGDREQESSAVFPLGREARARVLDAVLGIIDRSTSQQPTLVVVDDLQWVDEDTLFVLIALARRASTLPLVVGLTTRTHPRPAPLTTARRALVDAGAELLTIAPLPREVLPSLVADLVGSNPGPRLLADAGRAGGNPFLVIELVSSHSASGQLVESDEQIELTGAGVAAVAPKVSNAVLARVERLAPSTVELLRAATVLGRTFSLDVIAPVLDWPGGQLAAAVTEALDAGLLQEVDEELSFTHDLVREAIYASLPNAVRNALHLEAARALAERGADPLTVAAQYQRTTLGGDDTVEWSIRAAERVHSTAPATAAEFWRRAGDLLPPDDPRRTHVQCRLADALAFSGELKEAEALSRATQRRPDLAPADARAISQVLGQTLFLQGRLTDAAEVLEQGVGDDDPHRSRVLADSAFVHLLSGEMDRAEARAEEAEAVARATNDAVGETAALCARSWITGFRGDLLTGVELSRQAVACADASGQPDPHRNIPCAFHALSLLWAGRDQEAAAMLDRARDIGRRLGLTWDIPLQHLIRARLLLHAGKRDEARAEAQAGVSFSDDMGGSVADVWLRALLARVAIEDGDLGTAEALTDRLDEEAAQTGQGQGEAVALRAQLLEARGDPSGAADLLGLLWDEYAARDLGSYLSDVAEDLVRVALVAGRQDRVDQVLAAMRQLAAVYPGTPAVDAEARCRELVEQGARPEQPRGAGARFGWDSLTKREREVVDLVAASLSNTEIADKLFCSRRTVESHLSHVYTKLGVGSRVELVVEALARTNR